LFGVNLLSNYSLLQRKPPKGKGKEAANPTTPTAPANPTTQAAEVEASQVAEANPTAPVTQETVMVEASQVVDANPPDTSAVPDTNAPDQVGDTSAVPMDATHDEVVEASQVVDATHDQPSQEGDFFDDIPDYDMLTFEELIARDIKESLEKRGQEERVEEEQSKLKKVKI
jgi:hypothetical protein